MAQTVPLDFLLKHGKLLKILKGEGDKFVEEIPFIATCLYSSLLSILKFFLGLKPLLLIFKH